MKSDQGVWNFLASVVFALLTVAALWWLWSIDRLPSEIAIFDFILIVLAVFRLIRLFGDDVILGWFRDLFLDNGSRPERGVKRTITELLNCPWCTGVWMGLLVTFFYYASEFAWYPILILAVAGAGSLLRVTAKRILS